MRPELASVAAGVLGSLVALEVVKHRLGRCRAASGALHFDVVQSTLTEQLIAPDPRCPVCTLEGRASARP
jgi:hypothetical protein